MEDATGDRKRGGRRGRKKKLFCRLLAGGREEIGSSPFFPTSFSRAVIGGGKGGERRGGGGGGRGFTLRQQNPISSFSSFEVAHLFAPLSSPPNRPLLPKPQFRGLYRLATPPRLSSGERTTAAARLSFNPFLLLRSPTFERGGEKDAEKKRERKKKLPFLLIQMWGRGGEWMEELS